MNLAKFKTIRTLLEGASDETLNFVIAYLEGNVEADYTKTLIGETNLDTLYKHAFNLGIDHMQFVDELKTDFGVQDPKELTYSQFLTKLADLRYKRDNF